MELLCPRGDPRDELIALAETMVGAVANRYELQPAVRRGLAYYTGDGFEITCPQPGAQKQILGGGSYTEGAGFAIGVERLILAADVAPDS
ncbi:MAG: ATP phosphoribosyltransferase regulatory subunit [Mycobacteriales bacterium]